MANLHLDPTEVLPATTTTTAPQPRIDEKTDRAHSDEVGRVARTGGSNEILSGPNGEEYPTAEELVTLRKVKGRIDPLMYSIALVELIERFAYYGTIIVFTNYIQHPRPEGSPSGAGHEVELSGGLDMGQQASTGLTLLNSFWAYLMPLFGGYFADSYWGKYKTINVGIIFATVGHILIVISSIPAVLDNPRGALAAFILGMLIFGVGVGFFKANISPMIAEQYEAKFPRAFIKTLSSGERVIVDPIMTYSIIYMRYYLFINVGALVGQITMVYAENYVGFWLAYLMPTLLFLLCPFIMIFCRNRYVRNKPTGSVLGKSIGLLALAIRKNGLAGINKPGFWDHVKPSRLGADKPHWMTFDDAWVDEVRRGFKACAVFLFFPLYWLPYNQLNNNLISQAATMRLGGVPNDVVNNLDPLALIIFIPIADKLFYPFLARKRIRFTPIRKIFAGFILSVLSMAVSAIIQHYIYAKSPCGYDASAKCPGGPPDLSVWVQTPAYVLIAFSEILASITGLEYAFTKAPRNMRGLVTGVFWFAQAFSSALAQAFVPLAKNPLLVWLYITITILAALGGIAFWWCFRGLDAEEEALNALPDSVFVGKQNEGIVDTEAAKMLQLEQEKLRHAQGLD